MKLRRLLYWKLARIGALQDLVHIARRPPEQVIIIRRIGHQSARLDILAKAKNRGELLLDRELRDAAALAHQKSVRRHHEGIRPIFVLTSRALYRGLWCRGPRGWRGIHAASARPFARSAARAAYTDSWG